ncbi:NUDIX hydrolase [Betaproteobacteria bacterium SCN2]|nr:NUDIX hydrolase [Betaproteobacteria bacterium SCN2]
MKKPAKQLLKKDRMDFPRPLTTVDVVIFTVLESGLNVLLVQRPEDPNEPYPGGWALPGGFVDIENDQDLESCARRKLKEKTGVDTPYLEQLGSWGGTTRDPRGWSATHVYFALIPAQDAVLQKGANAQDVAWFPVNQSVAKAKLAFDHLEILQAAISRLRNKVEYTSLPAYLLPEKFTLSELQHMYEVVMERPIEKSAFRTRVLSSNLVTPIQGMREGPNRPAQLYRLTDPNRPVFFPRTFKQKQK